ncbi:methyl-accepting chemotaxis protein [Paenibacillus xylaniclasticus]|uniref:methyl-accepting chemotaxis protein n=1 Tax=Paenibacillus xylaniclasticus TaxID=588083 RepID=UPI000FD88A1D|nr:MULTISPECIES: methyl-accepting chemotaxis protein [Paenibacillus]GFN31337.1 putative methyl-accepting chemotaxis protein YoaH [Paenibacillus curdlanolyticus]
MKIKYKLVIACLSVALLMTLMIIMNSVSNEQKKDSTLKMLQEADYLNDLRMLQYSLADLSNDERAYLLNGDEGFREKMSSKSADISDILTRINSYPFLDERDQSVLYQINAKLDTYNTVSAKVIKLVDSGNKQSAIAEHFGDERTARMQLDLIVRDAADKLDHEMSEEQQAYIASIENQERTLLAISISAIVVILIISILLITSVVRPILNINRQLEAIAEGNGDLSRELNIRSKDEIGQLARAFNKMTAKLRVILSQAMNTAEQVASSSSQLSASAEQTTRATEHIVEATQNTFASVEIAQRYTEETNQAVNSMAAGIEQLSSSNEQLRVSANFARTASTTGAEAANAVLQSMGDMHANVQQTTSIVLSLGNRSQQIDSITNIITDIATRTNLLALNASIEASRVGEHGRGFAVVAQEIRTLAEQSRQSAQQIGELIQEVVRETGQAVASMSTVADQTQQGLLKTEKLNDLFLEIGTHAVTVDEQAVQAAATTSQLAASSKDIVQMTATISEAGFVVATSCQNNSASTEEQLAAMQEISSYSETLARAAGELRETLSRFKLQ